VISDTPLSQVSLGENDECLGGIIQKFGEVWTKTGLLPGEMGRELNKGFELRNQARCERHASMGENEAKVILALADQFIDALSAELGV